MGSWQRCWVLEEEISRSENRKKVPTWPNCIVSHPFMFNREVKIYVYDRPVTANAKLQVGFEGKFYKFSTSF